MTIASQFAKIFIQMRGRMLDSIFSSLLIFYNKSLKLWTDMLKMYSCNHSCLLEVSIYKVFKNNCNDYPR